MDANQVGISMEDVLALHPDYQQFRMASWRDDQAVERADRVADLLPICDECGHSRVLDQSRASLLCPECGLDVQLLSVDVYSGSYRQRNNAYQPSFHFAERLQQFRLGDSYIEPDDELRIYHEFEECYGPAQIRALKGTGILLHKDDVAYVLRRIPGRFSRKYLEKWLHVNQMLTGHEPPVLTRLEENLMRARFNEVVRAFQHLPRDVRKKRRHLPNYNFIIMRFLELMGRAELYPYFPQLKTVEKLRQQDAYWRQICENNHWHYIQTDEVPLYERIQASPSTSLRKPWKLPEVQTPQRLTLCVPPTSESFLQELADHA